MIILFGYGDLANNAAKSLSGCLYFVLFGVFVQILKIRDNLAPFLSRTGLKFDRAEGRHRRAAEIVKENPGQVKPDRRNELEIELRFALNGIANRLDRGFSFEVTARPLDEPKDGDDDGLTADERNAVNEHLAAIAEISENTKFLKLEGSPILKLEEKKPAKKKN